MTRAKRTHASPRLAASQQAVEALLSAADGLRRHFELLLAPYGITFQQYNVLRILRGAGTEGLRIMEIRRRMIEEAPGITGLIDRLEKKGLVERRRSARDRREIPCRVTRAGRDLLRRLDDPVDGVDRAAFSALGVEEVEGLTRLLSSVPTGLRREE